MLPTQIENFIGLKGQGWQTAALCPLAWLPRMEVTADLLSNRNPMRQHSTNVTI